MLNYVWLFLIVLGVGSAIFLDVRDIYTNEYDKNVKCLISVDNDKTFLLIKSKDYNKSFNDNIKHDLIFTIKNKVNFNKNQQTLILERSGELPKKLNVIAKNSGNENDITVVFYFSNKGEYLGVVEFEKVRFINIKEITSSALNFANTAVEIVLGLIGIMALWLGIMKVAEESGLIRTISKAAKPLMKYLFPTVPTEHPATGAIIMNLSATFLGLGNAATPFGIKAMEELNTLNDKKDTASDAMCMFLVLNTASFALMPATAIALRASLGSSNPAIIIGTTMFGSFVATLAGIFFVKLFQNFPKSLPDIYYRLKNNLKRYVVIFGFVALLYLLYYAGVVSFFSMYLNGELFKSLIEIVSILAIPFLIAIFVIIGFIKKVKVYETFIEGAKEGFNIAVTIIPYLVAILVAIGIFRTGGAMDLLINLIKPITNLIGMPPEVVPMALMRPLSGSGSLGILAEIMKTYGTDSFIGVLASTMFGSTETTFFVLAVYFGAVNIKKTRYALAAGLLSDFSGFLAAIFIVRLLFSL